MAATRAQTRGDEGADARRRARRRAVSDCAGGADGSDDGGRFWIIWFTAFGAGPSPTSSICSRTHTCRRS